MLRHILLQVTHHGLTVKVCVLTCRGVNIQSRFSWLFKDWTCKFSLQSLQKGLPKDWKIADQSERCLEVFAEDSSVVLLETFGAVEAAGCGAGGV